MPLPLKSRDACTFDQVSLGEIMLRLDPGEGRIRTARQFQAVGEPRLRQPFLHLADAVAAALRGVHEHHRVFGHVERTGFIAIEKRIVNEKLPAGGQGFKRPD